MSVVEVVDKEDPEKGASLTKNYFRTPDGVPVEADQVELIASPNGDQDVTFEEMVAEAVRNSTEEQLSEPVSDEEDSRKETDKDDDWGERKMRQVNYIR